MIYVMSDLHGYPMEKFLEIMKNINFSSEDFLYVLGDVIDRGRDGVKLLKWLMQNSNTQLLLGNHEDMMLKCEFLFEEGFDYLSGPFTGKNALITAFGPQTVAELP